MKISVEEVDRVLQTQSVARTSGNGSNGNGKTTAVNGHTPAAAVEVSARTQEIQRVKKLVNETPDVREDQVAALTARIEQGTYRVTGAEIADLIVRRAFADNIR